MRRIVTTTAVVIGGIAASAAPALATAPPTTPPDTAPVDTGASAELSPATTAPATPASESVEVVDESGTVVAAVSVTNIEPAWTGFAEGEEPESGHEYLRVTVVVESRSPRGLFPVSSDDFFVQDVDGFVNDADIITTAEQAAGAEPIEQAELAEGETIEFPLTFEVVSGIAPQALFYVPDFDRLITVHEFEG